MIMQILLNDLMKIEMPPAVDASFKIDTCR